MFNYKYDNSVMVLMSIGAKLKQLNIEECPAVDRIMV